MGLDIVIKGGRLVDGSGGEPFNSDIGIRDGKISEIGNCGKADRIIDADGAIITPGFIDLHTPLRWPGDLG